MALPVALFALIIVGALVAVAFQVAHLEQRAGRSSLDAAQALEAAEAGLALVLGEWEAFPQLGALAVNDSVALPNTALGPRAAFQPTVLRLTDGMLLIRSHGVRTDAAGTVLAQRVVGALARVEDGAVVPVLQRNWIQLY
jgi:hypothetical protein